MRDLDEILADLLNAILFKRKAVKPGDLSDLAVHNSIQGNNRLLEIKRDVYKLLALPDGRKLALGIEIQSSPDQTMPMRIAGYDGVGYQRQLVESREAKKKRKKGDTNGFFESFPIATIVLYIGTATPWNCARSISQYFGLSKEVARLFHLDQELLLIDLGALAEEDMERLESDLKYIVRFIHSSRNRIPFIPDGTIKLNKPVSFFRLLAALKESKLDQNQLEEYFKDDYDERKVQEMIISFLTQEEQQKIWKEASKASAKKAFKAGWKEGSEITREETSQLYRWLIGRDRLKDALKAMNSDADYQRFMKEMNNTAANADEDQPSLLN